MRWWPRSLLGRVVAALACAGAAILALQFGVDRRDQQQRAARGVVATPERARAVSRLQALGFALRPSAAPVLVASRLQALAPDVAPVVEVLADGNVALRRPGRVPQAPMEAGVAAGQAGIVLPVADLALLQPAARGTLVELLAALVTERPVPIDRIRLVDVQAGGTGLGPVLAWVP